MNGSICFPAAIGRGPVIEPVEIQGFDRLDHQSQAQPPEPGSTTGDRVGNPSVQSIEQSSAWCYLFESG
jgi:hypothetical protein